MTRKYIALWDNGHDRGEFEFYSSYRSNSKNNKKDAEKESILKYGYVHNITSTYLINY